MWPLVQQEEDDEQHKKVEIEMPTMKWISVYNPHQPMKQRYHFNVANERLSQHIEKGYEDRLFINNVASGFTTQVHEISPKFLQKEWIMEQRQKNYYISAIVGFNNENSLVVMSKGTQYLQQSYRVDESFHSSGSIKNGDKSFMSLLWPLLGVDGKL